MSDLPADSLRWLAAHHGVITTARAALARGRSLHDCVRLLVAAACSRTPRRACSSSPRRRNTLEQPLRRPVRCPSRRLRHRTDGRDRSPASAGCRRSSALHFVRTPRRPPADHPGVRWRQTTVIRAAIGDDARRHRRRVLATAGVRPRRRSRRARSPLGRPPAARRAEGHAWTSSAAIDGGSAIPARPGSGRFRRTLLAIGGAAPNESHPEVVLADALRRRDVPVEAPGPGHPARAVGPVIRVDLAVPAVRWGVELDIHPEHRSFDGHAADAERRRELHRMAWQIETVTEHDMADPERLADELAGLYRLRVAAPGPSECFVRGPPASGTRTAPKHSDGAGVRWWGPRCGGRRRRRGST